MEGGRAARNTESEGSTQPNISLIPKPLSEVTNDDIGALIEAEAIEGKSLEFKRELPGKSDQEKREVLADISSFANTDGGDLIYGIDESSGVATSTNGLPKHEVDGAVLWLENLMRTGLDPRISGVIIRPIETVSGEFVVVVRIPQSWNGPHRVVIRGHDKFYGRNSAGKYPLDVSELRTAFALSEGILDRIRDFRADRIIRILSGDTPVPMIPAAKLVVHVLPLVAFQTAQFRGLEGFYQNPKNLGLLWGAKGDHRINLDGVFVSSHDRSVPSGAYTQIFRNGCIEAVGAFLIGQEQKLILADYERYLFEAMPHYLAALAQIDVGPPVFLFLSFLNVSGHRMVKGHGTHLAQETDDLDRNQLDVHEAVLPSLEGNLDRALQSLFDQVWNAWGVAASPHFDPTGRWIGEPIRTPIL